jgi:plastocyanin
VPAGVSLAITASGTRFDRECLAVPASRPFTITFDNKDGTAHNIAILEPGMASDVLFRADLIPGPSVKTLRVAALKPGTYAFQCEVHPDRMSGNLVVK